jgi:hypothetical protein
VARKPDGYYTDKSGKIRPRHDPKGKGSVALLAIGLAVAMGAGAAGVGAGPTLGGSASRSGGQGGSARAGASDVQRAVVRLQSQGFRVTIRLRDDATDCASNSYGAVQRYFAEHPCTALLRTLLEVRDNRGDVVLVAIAWVTMPSTAEAVELKRLMDQPGTGNVTELSRQSGRYRTVRFTGDFYASNREGLVVVNAQAQPVARGVSGLVATTIVTHAVR